MRTGLHLVGAYSALICAPACQRPLPSRQLLQCGGNLRSFAAECCYIIMVCVYVCVTCNFATCGNVLSTALEDQLIMIRRCVGLFLSELAVCLTLE